MEKQLLDGGENHEPSVHSPDGRRLRSALLFGPGVRSIACTADAVRVSLLAVAALAVLFVSAGANPAASRTRGAVLTVNDFNDAVDASPGDGICLTAAGRCTLRAAVMEANGLTSTAETIVLGEGTYRLTIPPVARSFPLANDGDLYLGHSQQVTIIGAGAGRTIIEQTAGDRVIRVGGTAMIPGNTISGVTIRGGRETGESLSAGDCCDSGGGGILSQGGDLTLRGVVVTRNEGGGIEYFSGGLGRLRLEDSVVSDNRGVGVGVLGGATITLSTISGNTALGGAGLSVNAMGPSGLRDEEIRVENSLIADNTAEGGYVPSTGGPVFVSRCGGLCSSGGTVRIVDTTIRGNTAGKGAGIWHYGEGTLVIERSAIYENTATAGGGALIRGRFVAENATFSNNAAEVGGGLHIQFNPICQRSGDTCVPLVANETTLRATTIAGNTASTGSGIWSNSADNRIQAAGTILANSPANGNCALSPDEPLGSLGSNLETGESCHLAGTGDLSGADPRLRDLADNGGPTWTRSLRSDSPAIDAYRTAGCPSVDQRYYERGAAGGACDIGAFEAGAAPAPWSRPRLPVGDVLGGRLTFTPTPAFRRAMSSHDVTLRPFGPAAKKGPAFRLPLVAGHFAQPQAELTGRGGIDLSCRGRTVRTGNYALLAAKARATLLAFLAPTDGPLPLLTITQPLVRSGRVSGQGRLTPQAARVLDRLCPGVFRAGMGLGLIDAQFTVGKQPLPPPPPPTTPAPTTPTPTTPTPTPTPTTTTTTTTTTPPPAQLPDLVIDSLSTFSFTVANIGKGSAGDFVVNVSGVIGPLDFKISGLAPGQKAQMTWKTCKPGTITATADSTNLIKETDEKNNTRSFTIPKC